MTATMLFTEAYQKLNAAQKQAVDAIDGPVLVIAGPGTGKTQILTLRIVNILQQTDTPPDAILALTFTEAAAKTMRDRLRRYIGADAYRVSIFTFHGFAEYIINTYQESFPRVVGGMVANDVERYEFIKTVLDNDTWPTLRPSGKPDYYVSGILQQISACKREYMTPEKVQTWIESMENDLAHEPKYHESGAHKGKLRRAYLDLEKKIKKHREFLAIYRQYEALLASQDRYDFDDLILELVRAMQTDELLLRQLQEQYHYLLADEHQDVNESQNKILQSLASYHERPNIFVVGDEKQAIYRFQGASLSNFLFFGDTYTETTTISLVDNYRSGQKILDASQQVIATTDEKLKDLRTPLVAAGQAAAEVHLREFTHSVMEEHWVVKEVSQVLEQGVAPEEIAVIVRTNHSVDAYATRLRSFGIPVRATAEGAINQHPIVFSIRMLLRAIVNPTDDEALAGILHAPYWGLNVDDLVRILAARKKTQPLYLLLEDTQKLTSIGVVDTAPLKTITETISSARAATETTSPHHLLEQVLHKSGWLAYIHQSDPLEGSRVVRRFYDAVVDAVERGVVRSLGDIVRLLAVHEQYGIPLQAPYLQQESAAVNVLTAHKAKGLEYDVVIVPELTDNAWGGGRARSLFTIPLTKTSEPSVEATMADDQRLLYVAMTRARQLLHLSYSLQSTDGRPRSISRLLEPILGNSIICNQPNMSDFEHSLIPTDTFGTKQPTLEVSPELIKNIFVERGFSPTSYNNYRNDPWTFLYRNILRIPEFPSLSMQFGTVMHRVWERAVESFTRDNHLPETGTLIEYLTHALSRQPLTEHEYSQLHQQGLETLPTYRSVLESQLRMAAKSVTEQHVKCVLDGVSNDLEIPLSGTLDRIDYDTDGRIIRVVDYKTGSAKSRNAIMGATASSDGNYYTQLQFYALLLQLRGEYHSNIAFTLSFIEPDSQARVKEEVFHITEEEIAGLVTDLRSAVESITSGAFLKTPCNKEQCHYCGWIAIRAE